MSKATYFVQECPTCGRHLQVRVWYLGKKVACQHCGGHFLASDPDGEPVGAVDTELSGLALLQKADQLLATIEAKRRTQ
jgi:DNA-directed RNA polymerase subunit RPC12/RpoP